MHTCFNLGFCSENKNKE